MPSAPTGSRRGADRAAPVRPGRLDDHRRGRRSCASRPRTAEVAAVVRVCRDHGRPFVPRGSGTGLAGGATPAGEVPPVVIVTTKMNRILEVDRRRSGWRGSSPACSTSTCPGPSPPSGCTSPPTRRASSPARSAATWPTTRAVPTASSTASPAPTSSPSRSSCPTARSPCSAASTPSPTGSTCGGRSSAARAPWASPPASPCASRRCPRRWPPCWPTSRTMGDAAAAVTGIIAAGIVPAALEMMDASDRRGGRGLRPRRLPDRRRRRAAGRGGRPAGRRGGPDRDGSATSLLAHGARHGAGGRRRRPSGPCGGRAASRPSGPSPASPPTTTCTTAWCPGPAWSRCSPRWAASPPGTSLILGNVFHAGDGNLHPLIVFDRRTPGRAGAGARRRARRSSRRAWPPAAPCRASTASAWRSATPCPWCSPPADLEAQRWLRDAFDPAGPVQPREGAAPGRLPLRRPRRAAGRGVGVNDWPLEQLRRRGRADGTGARASGGRTQWDVGGAAAAGRPGGGRPGRRGGPRAGRDDRPGAGRHHPGRAASRPSHAGGQDVALEADDPGPGHRRRDPGRRSQRLPAARRSARCATPCWRSPP